MQRARAPEHLDAKRVLPEDIADLEDHPAIGGSEEPVVEGARLDRPQVQEHVALALVAQEIAAEVEKMAAEVLQDPAPGFAPGTEPLAHRAIAVEHAHAVELADGARVEQLLEPHDRGLEAVIVRGIPDGAAARAGGERLGLVAAREEERLFHQDRLAFREEAADIVELGRIRGGHDHRVVRVGVDLVHRPHGGPGRHRIHRGGAARPQKSRAARADIAEADDEIAENAHRRLRPPPRPA